MKKYNSLIEFKFDFSENISNEIIYKLKEKQEKKD